MMASPNAKSLIVASCAGILVLAIGSALPIWDVWIDYGRNSIPHPCALWQALAWLPANIDASESSAAFLWSLHEDNVIRGIILCALTLTVEYLVFRSMERRRNRCSTFRAA
jgi:hypothetical protein